MQKSCAKTLFCAPFLAAGLFYVSGAQAANDIVNIYTYREPGLIQPLFDRFTHETGIKTQVVFAKDGLEKRIEAEGRNSPADVLLTIDMARLKEAKDLGITQPVQSSILSSRIPVGLRDTDHHWFALSMRARVIYAARDVKGTEGLTYEDLASPVWKGQICLRSGQHQYNNALFAAYLVHYGEKATTEWLKGLKANLAQKPSGGDRDVARDIAAGKCRIGLGNTYYVGLMQGNPENKAWVEAIKIVMPTFRNGGTHINVSGAAVARYAPNKEAAIRLVEWLAGDEAQSAYAASNFEYPVVASIAASDTVRSWGILNPDKASLVDIAAQKKAATAIVDAVAFDEGP